ncbi:MAG: hypothetical protein J6C85_06100 [Alphaproteobacteria bacterium]|nr:hypothetical protein [Alphaproteobacteria bacterium]
MIQNLIYRFYNILSAKSFRILVSFALIFGLSGCEKDDDTSLGEDGNYAKQADCWQTVIIDKVLMIIDRLYQNASNEVTRGSSGAAVICIAFSIWMAFKLLNVLASFKEENLGEVWTEIGQKLFLCAACAYLVSNTEHIAWVFNTLILPIYKTLAELGLTVLEKTNVKNSFSLGDYKVVTFTHDPATCKIPDELAMSSLKGDIAATASCVACTINDRLNSGIRIGITLICSLRISAILVGLSMLLIFTAAKLFFILFLVDSLFRLNFAVFLIPFLIVGVPFNYTRPWSKYGLLMFLNSSGIMLFLALLISLAMAALEKLLASFQGSLVAENIEGLGPILLSIFLLSALFINIPGMGVALADKFIGGGQGMEFQKKISQFVMNAVKKAAASFVGGSTAGATNAITTVMEKYEATRAMQDNIKQMSSKASSKLDSLAGYNNDD